MKKTYILIILCTLGIMKIAKAQQQVTKNEARNAAISTLYNKADALNRSSSDTEIDTVYSFFNNRSNVLLYEVVFKNRATVLLSGSKACLPVLGYYIKPDNDHGAIFDTTNTNVPCCLQAFLYDYIQEIELSFSQGNIELYYEEQWNVLQQSDLPKNDPPTTIIVAPLLTTKWNQSRSKDGICDAYNYHAPNSNEICSCDNYVDAKCPAGCVAVAMAQIMKYWNYPVYLPNKVEQYDWCNMPDELLYYSNPNYEKQRNAINHLLEDCADKADMAYCMKGECNSGAYDSDARKAFVNDFGYSGDADLQRKFWHTNSIWKERIKDNLNSSRPVYYSGAHGSSGHAFVCDGYGSDDFFHFNWGWGGSYHYIWFTLDNLSPESSNFNYRQHAIFYIYPKHGYGSSTYCNLTFPLFFHYDLGGTHQNVPQVYMKLESAPETYPAAWRTIEPGQNAEYVAHESIRLLPGFHAKTGSHFVARIDPCDNCNSAKVTVKSLNNGVEIEEEVYIAVGDQEEQALGENKVLACEPQVYPNPTTGLLTIDTKNENSFIQIIELYNTQGIKLFTFNGNQRVFQEIDISHLPSQMYILKIQVSGQMFTKKLILQK